MNMKDLGAKAKASSSNPSTVTARSCLISGGFERLDLEGIFQLSEQHPTSWHRSSRIRPEKGTNLPFLPLVDLILFYFVTPLPPRNRVDFG